MYTLPDGQRQILVQGRRRFEIAEFLETDPLLIARVTMVEEKYRRRRVRGENLACVKKQPGPCRCSLNP